MRLLTILTSVVASLAITGCTSHTSVQKPTEVVTLQKEFAPHIWSDHKELSISAAECADKGIEVLNSLGFVQIVNSSYGEYIYGNYSNNRAVIKCISVSGQTLVYSIVAGPKKALVEKLRNEIMWQY